MYMYTVDQNKNKSNNNNKRTIAELLELCDGGEGGSGDLPLALGQEGPGSLGPSKQLVESPLDWGQPAAHHLLHLQGGGVARILRKRIGEGGGIVVYF